MKLRILKAALAGIILSVSGFANAGLILSDFSENGDTSITFDLTGTISTINSSENYLLILGFLDGTNITNLHVSSSWVNNLLGTPGSVMNEYSGFVDSNIIWNYNSTLGLNAAIGNTVDMTFTLFGNFNSANLELLSGSFGYNNIQNIRASYTFGNNYNAVPEPSTLAIFALGIMGLASRRFKKQ